jgi:hypothetical protein
MVFPTSITEDISIGGIPEAFSWLQYAFENLIASPDVPGRDDNPSTPGSVLGLQTSTPLVGFPTSWTHGLHRPRKKDSAPEEFISQF